jgi:biopolymer transport protein ExbD
MINITPLVDVVFLMLVFFLLTSSFVRYRSVDLDFVDVELASRSGDADLIVRLSETGLSLQGVPINVNELSDLILERASGQDSVPVLVLVGENVRLQLLVVVLDAIRAGGPGEIRLGRLTGSSEG